MQRYWENFPEILCGLSERKDGSMKLFSDDARNQDHRQTFFASLSIDIKDVVAAEIVHGNKAEYITKRVEHVIPGADALITDIPGLYLSVTVADCIPVYFWDPKRKMIAIAHCGWKGIVRSVVNSTVRSMLEHGSAAGDIRVVLGPGINACHFQIGEDTLREFSAFPAMIEKRGKEYFVDLKEIIRKQLDDLGILRENVFSDDDCTFELPQKYFSYRRDKPEKVEAMVAFIGII